jgi:serine/threonine protein phosphatase PrpC
VDPGSADPGPAASTDHFEADLGDAAAVTDRGRRHPINQDAFALRARDRRAVWAVCDGVSSSTHPEVAAATAARAVVAALAPLLDAETWPAPAEIRTAVERASDAGERAVLDLARPGDPTSATTLVLGALGPDHAVVGSIGDSRIYWIDAGPDGHQALTDDDSWAQEAIRNGIPPADAHASPQAHIITRCLRTDAQEPTPPNLSVVEIAGPGHLVVCTDGLWNYVEPPDDLAALVASSPDPSPIGVARHLVEYANNAGGSDNITVAVITAGPGPSPADAGTGPGPG